MTALAARYRAACRALGIPVWRTGMLAAFPSGRTLRIEHPDGLCPSDDVVGRPDLTDPATLGCLLAAVREAWACPILRTSWEGPDLSPGEALPETTPGRLCWRAWLPGYPVGHGATEADALVTALEAAAARRGGQS
jgi:hypothetical protein